MTTCNNTLYQPRALQLIQSSLPPVKIAELYKICRSTFSHAMVTAAGVAAGNAALASVTFLTLSLMLLISCMNFKTNKKVLSPFVKAKRAAEKEERHKKAVNARFEKLEDELASALALIHSKGLALPPPPQPPPTFRLSLNSSDYQDNPMLRRDSASSRSFIAPPIPPLPPRPRDSLGSTTKSSKDVLIPS